jgi:hypothetical protein
MAIKRHSYESWLAEVNDVIRRYRLGIRNPRHAEKLPLDHALAQLRTLGLTTGEATRLLRATGQRDRR